MSKFVSRKSIEVNDLYDNSNAYVVVKGKNCYRLMLKKEIKI